MFDVAAEFFYREMEARRKAAGRNLYARISGIPRLLLAASILTIAALALLALIVVALTGGFR